MFPLFRRKTEESTTTIATPPIPLKEIAAMITPAPHEPTTHTETTMPAPHEPTTHTETTMPAPATTTDPYPSDPTWVNPTKTCRRCQMALQPTAFSAQPRAKDGLQSWCKACNATYSKERTLKIKAERERERAEKFERRSKAMKAMWEVRRKGAPPVTRIQSTMIPPLPPKDAPAHIKQQHYQARYNWKRDEIAARAKKKSAPGKNAIQAKTPSLPSKKTPPLSTVADARRKRLPGNEGLSMAERTRRYQKEYREKKRAAGYRLLHGKWVKDTTTTDQTRVLTPQQAKVGWANTGSTTSGTSGYLVHVDLPKGPQANWVQLSHGTHTPDSAHIDAALALARNIHGYLQVRVTITVEVQP